MLKPTRVNFYLYRSSVSPQAILRATIDNVSVKQVDPNDRWSVTANVGWNITDKANYEDSITNSVYQSGLTLTSGKKYKLTLTISDASGTVLMWIGNYAGAVNYEGGSYRPFTNGNHTIVFDMPSDQTTLAFFGNTGGSSFSLDNISLVEVQGDRPRLSYDITNGVVEDKPHLLLEPSSTNLLTFSNDYTQSTWSGTQGLTLTANNAISPEGIVNATKLEVDGSNSNPALGSNGSITIGQTYTLSIFVKNINFSGFVRLAHYSSSQTGAWFDLDNGVVGTVNSTSATIDKFPNGWYKLTNTFVALQSTNTLLAMLGFSDTDGSVTSTVTGQSVLAYGAQLEQQSYATSFIPTAGTTITRAAETCNNSKPSVNSTEGVLYAEIQALASDSTDKVITMSDGSTSNRVQVYFNSSNQIVGGLISGGSGQAAITYSTDIKLVSKIAFKFKQNDFALWVNGSEVGTDVVGNPATGLNVIDFDNGAGGANFYGKLKGLAVYNEALSESQLMQLTGVTASSIYNNFVTRTASFTVEALNEVKKVIDNL
jgi:hypothetical protein